jgi:hypothetical protein
MGKIFKSQTKLRIQVDLDLDATEDIVGATPVLIKYIKPDGTEGSFTATIEDAFKGIIYYDIVSVSDIDVVGKWTLWAHITFSSGKIAAGEPFIMEVFNEGATC